MNKFIKTLAIIVFLVLGTTHNFAQQGVSNEINRLKAEGVGFELKKDVFQIAKTVAPSLGSFFRNPEEVSYLEYDRSILDSESPFISMEIPYAGKTLIVDLMDVSDEFTDVNVEVKGEREFVASTAYKHFRGVVSGDNQSLVSISFFEDNVIGVISMEVGTFNIVKLKNSNDYIIYNDANLESESDFTCSTEVGKFTDYDPEVLSGKAGGLNARSGKCVRLYFETEFDIFQSLGSSTNVLNYVTSLYNNVATIYSNESIPTALSQVVIWTSTDPYTATSASALLTQFQNQISSINGDLGQLITFRSIGGGIAAGFNGICNSNVDLSLCVSGNMTSTIVPFPTYSWNVMVVTHEFGHLFGSRHTHACVWNGNNTAIDGCAGFTEGTCALPPVPAGGGTIMSYCHINAVGINFSLGFGPQPGNVIRNIVNNAPCLTSCCPTDLTITANVPSGGVDHREASNTITALNTVSSGAEGVYHAENEVLLLDDFDALNGSEFRAYIEGCTGVFVKSAYADVASSDLELGEDLMAALMLSPNPTRDEFTIDLTKSDYIWTKSEIELYDLNGQRINLDHFVEIDRNTFRMNIADLEKGVYVIKLFKLESNESYVERIVKL